MNKIFFLNYCSLVGSLPRVISNRELENMVSLFLMLRFLTLERKFSGFESRISIISIADVLNYFRNL